MEIETIYEDNSVLVINKPAGIVVFEEGGSGTQGVPPPLSRLTLIDELVKQYPRLKDAGEAPRYGIVHRLDKDTSGILLVAKTNETLIFLQKQFSADAKALADKKNSQTLEKGVEKRYIALVEGNIKDDKGTIHTLIGRAPGDKRKQKAYPLGEIGTGKREAITEYKVLNRYKDYTLLEVEIKTGRRHQIRCHLSYLQHPITGDKLYSFKNSKTPKGLTRQFLHSTYLKIQLPASQQGGPNGENKEFRSKLPEELKTIINNLEKE